MDYAKSDSDRGVLELIFARQDMAYPIVAPPGVPAARVAELRRAFESVLKDPDYLADAKKQHLETDPMRGEDIAKLIQRIYASPPAVIARAKTALEDGKKFTIKR
jgi:tripartite-type tricarboxylate transporter receptor subunit TctC